MSQVSHECTALIDQFASGYRFQFDDFQRQACASLAEGHGVLVAAATGSGKTVVGEFACWLAVANHTKCFYTTPIKALSNQKFHDLVACHGADNVGLLTGDSSINSEAPIVVMTTEVLRNMIYARSKTLVGLSYVVLDEVHYLANRFRGAVWEEVILGLAESVSLVALSATVSNAEEFGEWLDEVRGGVDVVVSERRVVPLFQHVLVGRKLQDLFADGSPLTPTDAQSSAVVNPDLLRLAKAESRTLLNDSRKRRSRRERGRIEAHQRSAGKSPARPPRRDGAVEVLRHHHLLPAIFFVFSRQGCDQAVRQLMGSDIDLTTPSERKQLIEIAERYSSMLSSEDKRALNWDVFIEALGRGIAAHHAGLLPVFKVIVEQGFVRGLVKVVFATETLALGINMPARTVVVEKLVKYNGETHAELTPGEYTQLTGRAGRRGIDTEGHAVVFWQPGTDPRGLAGLASKRTYPLRSSFAPTYNMAVNLVGSVGRERSRELLEQSFAQFQTDRRVVSMARAASRDNERAERLWAAVECEHGDFREYAQIRGQISLLESEMARERKRDHRTEIVDSLCALEPGDVFWIPAGKHQGWAAVIKSGNQHDPWPMVMTAVRQMVSLAERDINQPVTASSRVRVPKRFDPHSASSRRQLANSLAARIDSLGEHPPRVGRPKPDEDLALRVADLRAQMRSHPCHSCPDRKEHARIAEQALRLSEEHQVTRAKARARAQSIANKFDRICGVLDSLGYLEGDQQSESGTMLARIYSERDLIVTEAIRSHIFDGLEVPALAAVLSTLVYESRGTKQGELHRMPDSASEHVQSQVRRIWRDLGIIERENRVDRTPAPDIGFAVPAYQWASGMDLAQVLMSSGLPAGDFVRWVRQVIDLAGQMAQAPGIGELATNCREVVWAMRRDIVDFAADED